MAINFMFFAFAYTETNKERKVKHTQKKLTNKKQFVILFSSTRMANERRRPCLLSLSIYILEFFVFSLGYYRCCSLCSFCTQAMRHTINGTLVYDDINDNNKRWRRKWWQKKRREKKLSKRQTHTHTYIHTTLKMRETFFHGKW